MQTYRLRVITQPMYVPKTLTLTPATAPSHGVLANHQCTSWTKQELLQL